VRVAAVCVLMVALALVVIGVAPGRSGGDDARYLKAHAALVKQKRRADDLQARLTVRVRQVRRLERRLAARSDLTPIVAIRMVFGRYAGEAIRVSSCETGGSFSVYARNGQYLGLFQMGDYARGRYGHSTTALGQAQAAYRYFVDSGRNWSPWECKP
jgi:hypothetical protein